MDLLSTVGVSGRHVKQHQATYNVECKQKTLEQEKVNLAERYEEGHQIIISAGTWPEEDTVIIVDPETGAELPADHIGEFVQE